MNSEDASNEKLLRIYHFILVGGIVVLVMCLFILFFIIPQTDRTLDTSVKTTASTFNERSLIIHNIWLTDSKRKFLKLPKWLNLYQDADEEKLGFDPDNVIFKMTPKGWPYDVQGIDNSDNLCRHLWLGILGHGTRFFVEDVKTINKQDESLCLFLTSVSGFSYNYENGTVSVINSEN